MLYKQFLFFLLANSFFLFYAPTAANAQTSDIAYAGVARVNITPPVGYAHYRGVSTGVHDSLYAKAVVWGSGDQRFALITCDLLEIERSLSSSARLLVVSKIGIPYSNIIIAATHSHTSPSYHINIDELNERLRPASYVPPKVGSGGDYPNWLAERIAKAVIDADKASVEVNLETGIANATGISFNRRALLMDGSVRTNAGVGNPDIIGAAGPVDPRVGIILLRRASDNKPIGCVSSFGLHADTVGGTEFSADYPGFLAKALQKEFGDEFISVFGAGACGDINHINVKEGSKKLSSQEIGEKLASVIKAEIPRLEKVRHPFLASSSEFVYASLQQYSEEELAWAEKVLTMAKNSRRDSLYRESAFLTRRRAVKIRSLHRMWATGEAIPPTIGKGPWTIPLQVQVFRIGDDTAIVGLPGELFTNLSMTIKEASPFKTTLVIELTNTSINYVPTEADFLRGGYETINSRLTPGGGELMVATAIRLLNKSSTAKGN